MLKGATDVKPNYADIIKRSLTIKDVIAHYGYHTNRAGFIRCPFHNDKTPSLKVYEKTNTWHCFGCGEGGDVISFVKKLFGLSFTETLKRIDTDFILSIFERPTLHEYRRAQKESEERKEKYEAEKAEKEHADAEYMSAIDEYIRLDINMRKYVPSSPDDDMHPLYIEALQRIDYAEYVLNLI